MIGRVTQGFIVNDFNNNLHSRQAELQSKQNELASGYRVNLPSEDPVAAVNFMDFQSRLREVEIYRTIVDNAKSKLNIADSALESVTGIIQRLRELSVQGANGIYTKDERQNMATEVDQLLRELASVANTSFKGNPLFGGTTTDATPFKSQYKVDEKTGVEYLENVRYTGNNQTQLSEVEKGEKIDVAQPGNQVFWADNMDIYSTLNVSGYTASSDSKINIDGTDIDIKTGDNLEVIAGKINNSGLSVKASVETKNGASYFALESTSPHQIALNDSDGGAVLQDLGLIDHGMNPPNNYSAAAKVFTGSIFDVMIDFRKDLLKDDTFKIGGTALMGVDNSLANILNHRAQIGSVSQRLDAITDRYMSDEVYLTEAKDNAIGTDIPKAMTELKMLEFSHDVALNVGARILPRTLLDFLR
jgi:flagellar hook-associated protein 3 FlgL